MKPFVLLAASVALLLTGCTSADAGDDGRMPVTAAFYPLQFAAERVGGEHVRVTSLTKPGVEPHDLELTPRAVGQLAHAKAVVYLAGFQPAVDQAVRTQAEDAAVDVTPAARLTLTSGDDHGGDAARDPHFWLDPTRLADVATALGDDFARRDPANAADYRANAAALVADLEGLDAEFRAGLAQCRTRELVTGHAAFGYLAERYDLHQEGVAGVEPRHRARRRDAARPERPRRATRVSRRSTPRAWSPPPWPRRSPARPASGWPCSTRSRASPTPRAATTTSR